MGEKIANIAEFTISNNKYKIEINKKYSKEDYLYDIHIQNDKMQISMNDKDYMKLVSSFVCAKRRLNSLKDNL